MLDDLLNKYSIDLDELINHLRTFITPERYQRMLEVLSQRTAHVVVVLEDIYQGHNASAVLRTCEGYGIQYVFTIENKNTFSPNEEISLGADKWVTIERFRGNEAIELAYEHLRKKGYTIIATAFTDDAVPLHEIDVTRPLALVFGTEKDGLSAKAINLADLRGVIPMYGFTRSFNVSVSAAITLEILTQKMHKCDIKRGLSETEQKKILIEWILQTISRPEEILHGYVERIKKHA